MIYATCIACEFEASGQSFDELDSKCRRHFVIRGHGAFFQGEERTENKKNLLTRLAPHTC